jgi:hypothetical protein
MITCIYLFKKKKKLYIIYNVVLLQKLLLLLLLLSVLLFNILPWTSIKFVSRSQESKLSLVTYGSAI